MKKLAMFSMMMIFIMFALTGCGKCKHEYDDGVITKEPTCTEEGEKTSTCSLCGETKIESVPIIAHAFDEEITKESTFKEEGEKTFTCKNCGYSYTESIPKRDDEVIVTVTKKTNIPQNSSEGKYYNRVEFSFDVTNCTDRAIRGIHGTLKIFDLFGEKILYTNCDFTGNTINPNSTITVDELGIDINEFMDSHTKLYNTDYSDLKFEYEITNIVYSDESNIDEQKTASIQNDKRIVVNVTDKQNLGVNYNAGRYSPRVEYTFEVFNNTEKEIKGIQGILTVKDLFGVDIMSNGLDFTGQIIPVNESITITGKGIDINEFIDSDVKLYNTDYEDLKFEYEITSIVYTDGTTE